MAATDVLQPLLDTVNNKLTLVEREEALNLFKSVYGENYQKQTDFRSAIGLLASENKVNISNTLILEEGVTENPGSKKSLKNAVKEFKSQYQREISEYTEKESKDFVGRDIKKLEEKINQYPGVILWGASGVEKTRFAKSFLSTWQGETKEIDLRGLDTIELVCVETLKSFGRPVNIDEASISMVCRVVEQYPDRKTILLFDNADDFIRYSGKGNDLTESFSSLLEGILKNSNGKMKIITTSREASLHSLAKEFLYQEEITSLDENSAKSIIEKYNIHEKESEVVIKTATDYCQNLPLNLKILGAAIQDSGVTLSDILPFILKEAEKWKKKDEKATKSEQFTFGVISSRFDKLSDTIQQSAVALSLFTRSFSFNTVEKVFKTFSKQRLFMILECLRHVNFISLENDNEMDKSKMVFDMHPRVREFLIGKTDLKHVNKFYLETRENFLVYFKDYLLNVGRLIESDYVQGYKEYQDEISNLEFLINNCKGELLFHEKYDDLQLVGSLLISMLNPDVRLTFFEALAKDLLQKGAKLLGVQLLCQAAICQGFYNPINAIQSTLLKIEHILRTEQVKNKKIPDEKFFKTVESLYLYTKGLLLYQMTHSSHSMQDCDASLEASKLSVELQEGIYPNGHTDLVRSYLNIGNGHNMKKDLCVKNTPEWRENVDLALKYYQKALEMKMKISNSELHFDIPQIYENIGTIHHQNENYDEAKRCYLKALDIEKQLNLDGFFNTTTKLVNLGALHQRLKQYEAAFDCYNQACEIRKALKGAHKDTVLTIYRMAEAKRLGKKYSEAVHYYKEAFHMEESLPVNYHSSVRMKIRDQLIKTMDLSLKRERRSQEELRSFQNDMKSWQEKFRELEAAETAAEKSSVPMEWTASETTSSLSASSMRLTERTERSVSYLFDEKGGFAELKYCGVYLTIPSNQTRQSSIVTINTAGPDRPWPFFPERLPFTDTVISDLIIINASDWHGSIAMLEIPCRITESDIGKSSQMLMMSYDKSQRRWKEIENWEVFIEECDWNGSVVRFPIVRGLISSLSRYVVVSRPVPHEYVIGKEGRTCRPCDNVELQFAQDTFTDSDCKCTITVFLPTRIQEIDSRCLFVSPFLSVTTSSKVLHTPVVVKLPVIRKMSQSGSFRILRNDSEVTLPLLDFYWHDVTDSVNLTLEEEIFRFEVTEFSWYVVLWVKDAAYETAYAAIESAFSAVWKIFRPYSDGYHATFHLYRGVHLDRYSFPIAISCVPFSSNEDEQYDLKMRPEKDGRYYYIDSQPSIGNIYNMEPALVCVHGKFENIKEDIEKRRFFLNSRDQTTPTKFRVEHNPTKDGGGDVEIRREKTNQLLCNIPYFGDFRSTENNAFAEEERRRSEPFRFLGLRLNRCGLEDVRVTLSDLRNRLYRTGIHETFIDEIKLASEHESQQMITKKVLNHITHKFRCSELANDWFTVFRFFLWPLHARKSITTVMDYLRRPLGFESESIIYEAILEDDDLHCFIGFLADKFLKINIKHPTCRGLISNAKETSRTIWKEIFMDNFRLRNKGTTMLDFIRSSLLIEEYPRLIQRILDRIGLAIENLVCL